MCSDGCVDATGDPPFRDASGAGRRRVAGVLAWPPVSSGPGRAPGGPRRGVPRPWTPGSEDRPLNVSKMLLMMCTHMMMCTYILE